MVPRVGDGGDPYNSIEQRALQNWQTRINRPKGNPNLPQTFMNGRMPKACGCTDSYQTYYTHCVAYGQTPMSPMEFMQAMRQGIDPLQTMQQGTDPLVTMQTGIQAGTSLVGLVTDIVGLFKSNKTSKASSGPTETQQTLMNNYQTALQSGKEFKVDSLKDFVNAQFAGMKANGDTVTKEQYTAYLKDFGFDDPGEAEVITRCIKSKDGNISKKDVQNFYKTAMGKSNTISAKKLEDAIKTILDKDEEPNTQTEIEKKLAAKGYNYIEVEKDGETIGGFQKDGEFIPSTDTDKLLQIIDDG